MTCIVACKSLDGVALLAADSCISWRFNHTGNRVYQDELQKLYGLTRGIAVAICGDLVPAQALLSACRAYVTDSMPESSREVSEVTHQLPRVLRRVWREQQLSGRVTLGVLVGGGADLGRILVWSSRAPEHVEEVKPGQILVRGSILNDPDLCTRLRMSLSAVCRQRPEPPGACDSFVALVSDRLASLFSNEAGRTVGVGGLFQIATADSENGPCIHGYEASEITRDGVAYQVALRIEDPNRLVQRDLQSGLCVPLVGLEGWTFTAVPMHPGLFSYGPTQALEPQSIASGSEDSV